MASLLLFIITSLVSTCTSINGIEDWQEVELQCVTDYNSTYFSTCLNQNNTKVTINCTAINLTSPLCIDNVHNVHIKGIGCSPLRIICNDNITGLNITKSKNLHLENLQIKNCGSSSSPSVLIHHSINITICGVTIEDTKTSCLRLWRFQGVVIVRDSNFRNCHNGPQQGGGLAIIDANKDEDTSITIQNCTFVNNSAKYGGGVFINTSYPLADLIINGTNFSRNEAEHDGGGVWISTFLPYNSMGFIFKDCQFDHNKAYKGGGVYTSFKNSYHHARKLYEGVVYPLAPPIAFKRCSWEVNIAESGQAVHIDSNEIAFLYQLNLTDCSFRKNNVHRSKTNNAVSTIYLANGGKMHLMGTINFEYNLGSAIKAVSSALNFESDSRVRFIGNKATKGGALQLLATELNVWNAEEIEFINNTADEIGGAIYIDGIAQERCFIHSLLKNTSIVFNGNTAGNETRGNTLHVPTFLPCINRCLGDQYVPLSQALKCRVNFVFQPELIAKIGNQISTAAHHFVKDGETDFLCHYNSTTGLIRRNSEINNELSTHSESIIPGKINGLPFKFVDEFCEESPSTVSIEVLQSNKDSITLGQVNLKRNFSLYGCPKDYGSIRVTPNNANSPSIIINVTIADCPPGYAQERDNEHNTWRCNCFVDKTKSYFHGIAGCDEKSFSAYIQRGKWVGYLSNQSKQKLDSLSTAICPEGFCNYTVAKLEKSGTIHINFYKLPSEDVDDLSEYVCSDNRRGILCGACKANYSAYYHSTTFQCKSQDLCHLGWLFYILSELVPVTIFFLIVIFFNISFTSGSLNGVMFFMQMVINLKINGEKAIQFDETVNQISHLYKLVYRIFALNFFAINELSFCLWEGASALDMLAFRYVTITYSLLLVLATVFLLRMCNFNKRIVVNLKRSIIHGLSAFIVISYSECTRVSLSIITKGTLHVGFKKTSIELVAFYNGDYTYMGVDHLKYAIPAICFLLTLVTVPPVLLLSYPLCYRLFTFLRIEESKLVCIICKFIPLEKIRPLFDSIQGDFKDCYRFFAGLYFFYRFITLLTFAYTRTLRAFYSITGVQFVCMLLMHATCCPYKKTWHNVLDTILFSFLTAINIITSYNFEYTSSDPNDNLLLLSIVQTILILLPLVYLLTYTVYCIASKLKTSCSNCQPKDMSEQDNSDYILYALDSRKLEKIG